MATWTDRSGSDASTDSDGDLDGSLNKWSTPTPVSIAMVNDVNSITLTDNQLELYFSRNGDIYQLLRTTPTGMFGNPQLMSGISTGANSETDPDVTGNGVTMFLIVGVTNSIQFASRPGGTGGWNGGAMSINELSSAPAFNPSTSSDGTVLVYESPNSGFYGTAKVGATWAAPLSIMGSNPSMHAPAVNVANGRIYYDQADVGVGQELYVADLSTSLTEAMMSNPVPLTDLNTTMTERDVWISADAMHIYFVRENMNAESTIYQSDRM